MSTDSRVQFPLLATEKCKQALKLLNVSAICREGGYSRQTLMLIVENRYEHKGTKTYNQIIEDLKQHNAYHEIQ